MNIFQYISKTLKSYENPLLKYIINFLMNNLSLNRRKILNNITIYYKLSILIKYGL